MTLEEMRRRIKALVEESQALIAKYPDFNFPDDDYARSKAIGSELEDLKGKIDRAKSTQDMVTRMSAYNDYVEQPATSSMPNFPGGKSSTDDDAASASNRGGSGGVATKERAAKQTVSQFLLADEEYKTWLQKAAPNGNFSEKVGFQSPRIMIPGGLKSLVTGTADGSAGAFIFNDVQRNLDQFITRRPLVMRDIITIGQTGSDTVEYVRQVSETNNAAMVPEATSSAVIDGGSVTAAMGGLKPESGMVFERVITNVKTVAHWMPATKRALADAGQMQTLIDSFLRAGLDEELEDQMVLGNGVGENFTGLVNIANVTAQAWDVDLLVTTRRARTKVRIAGRSTATAYLLNPYDWENIQLIRADVGGTEGAFLFGGPAAVETPTLWNLPVVECESVPVGTGYVGNFRTLVLWDREQAGVQMTDSHNDFFVRNLVAILAEARAAFGCLKPAAIVEMDLTSA